MLDRLPHPRGRGLPAAAAALLLVAGAFSGAATPAAAPEPNAPSRPSRAETAPSHRSARAGIVLSSRPERLELRQCMSDTLQLGITNESSEPTYADVDVTPDTPLWTSNTRVSTYVPAGGTVFVPIEVYVPEDAPDAEYEVHFATERPPRPAAPPERLSVTVAAAAVPDAPCIPRRRMILSASSAQEPENAPEMAIDGARYTIWHTRYRPERTFLPQSITFDLSGRYDVAELSYQPRLDGNLNGTITAYTILASPDGQTFTEVAKGAWAADASPKTAFFSAPGARSLRLEATAGVANYASAAEIVLFGRATNPPSSVTGSARRPWPTSATPRRLR